MRKDICDLCGGDLKIYKHADDPHMFRWWTYYRKNKIQKIDGNFGLMMLSPFLSPISKSDIEICSKCFDDFKEFIQRKKSFTTTTA